MRGFGVLCSGKTDTRSYVAQRDLPGGRTRRVTIAGVNELSLDQARARAADLVVEIRRGKDPKARQKSLTLGEALAAYRDARKNALRARSDSAYGYAVEKYLGDWLDRPLHEITRRNGGGAPPSTLLPKSRHASARPPANRHSATKTGRPGRGKGLAGGGNASPRRCHRRETAHPPPRPRRGKRCHAGAAAIVELRRRPRPDARHESSVRLKNQWFAVPRRERLVHADELPRFCRAMTGLENPVQRDSSRLSCSPACAVTKPLPCAGWMST